MNYEFHPEAEQAPMRQPYVAKPRCRDFGQRFGEEVERVVQLLLEQRRQKSQW